MPHITHVLLNNNGKHGPHGQLSVSMSSEQICGCISTDHTFFYEKGQLANLANLAQWKSACVTKYANLLTNLLFHKCQLR